MTELRFVTFGRPQQKGSKRVLPIRHSRRIVLVDANRNAAPWAARVRADAAKVQRGELLRGGVAVTLTFVFERPRVHYGTGRNARTLRGVAPERMTAMPDLDKLARCALDALTGVCFKDDAQVCELTLTKSWGDPERLEARVVGL